MEGSPIYIPDSVQIPLQDCLLLSTLLYRIRINNIFELFDSDNNDENNIIRLIEAEILEEVQESRPYNRIKQLTSRFKENTRDTGERDVGERDTGEGPSQALYKEGVNTNEDDIQLLDKGIASYNELEFTNDKVEIIE